MDNNLAAKEQLASQALANALVTGQFKESILLFIEHHLEEIEVEYWQEFFQKKFDGFSEQQKFSIFYKSLGENPIYVYNEAVQNWSEDRY